MLTRSECRTGWQRCSRKAARSKHLVCWSAMFHSFTALSKTNDGVGFAGIVPVVEQLLRQSKSTEYAFLCHPAVQHISKLRGEGGCSASKMC